MPALINSVILVYRFEHYFNRLEIGGERYDIALVDTAGLDEYARLRSISYDKVSFHFLLFSVL